MYEVAKNMSCTFPNMETLLQIFLTIPVSTTSGERSFSALKRVKPYLRNSMGEKRFNSLALLYIEQDVMNELETEKIWIILTIIATNIKLFILTSNILLVSSS